MLVRSEAWSHIILQEQSSLPRTNVESFRASVKKWVDYIREFCPNPNAIVIIPMNWAYSGDWSNFTDFNNKFLENYLSVARELGVSEKIIGMTILAAGTSLPELATSVVAARKGRSEMAIGNVIGSNLFNIFWVVGMCATIRPMAVMGISTTDFAMLLAGSLLFWLFARTKHRVERWEGVVLVACYVGYVAWLALSL